MTISTQPTTCTIRVIARHSSDCRLKHPTYDQFSRKCDCRKALYIYEGGKDKTVSTKTRSWERAEEFAQAERDRRDPVKLRLREIEEQEAHKATLQLTQDNTVLDVTKQWVAFQKAQSIATGRIYKRAARRIQEWAADMKIERMSGVTADALASWRGNWSEDAEKEYSRMGQTTQSHFQGRLKQFFRWCVDTEKVKKNPAAFMKHIPFNDDETRPLTCTQFKELIDSIPAFIAIAQGQYKEFGSELKALFLLQRYTGLRIQDALMLPRAAIAGNLLSLTTRKTKTKIDGRPLPTCVVDALQGLTADRPLFDESYFFWNKGLQPDGLGTRWGKVINAMNRCLSFTDEKGRPMHFHSHMLRDTFAVELLLAGFPIEDVSYLLTHKDIKVTQRHYAPWVKSRRDRLNAKLSATMWLDAPQ